MRVPLAAADLVDRAAAEPYHVEGVKANLRVGYVLAERVLIAGAHVDRHGPDRGLLLVGQLIEERLQRGGVAARGGPHDRAGGVVGDTRQEAMIG